MLRVIGLGKYWIKGIFIGLGDERVDVYTCVV